MRRDLLNNIRSGGNVTISNVRIGDYDDGYKDALKEVKRLLTTGEGRTESYEATLAFIEKELSNA